MNILIVGDAKDDHAAHLHTALTEAGATVEYLDTYLFPTRLQLSWHPHTRQGCLHLPSGRQLNLQDIKSVYWRNFNGVCIPAFGDSYQEDIAFLDAHSAVRSLFQAIPARWVNSWQAYEFHKEKPLQLSLAQHLGVAIPATLISNDPQMVTEFAKSYEKLIFKPVYGGSHARFVTQYHLEYERMSLALRFSPVTLQEYIPGTNIRSYVIGESVYSAEIRTAAVDFREDSEAELIPVELPQTIQQQCLAIAKAFMLDWTAIDWRYQPTGEYVFLEANPSPMFLYFEQRTGFPITQKLVQLLMS